jgi:MFS family permease
MAIYPAILFVSGILAGLAGFFVLAANKKSQLNRSWFLLNISLMFWLLGFGFSFTSNPEIAVFSEKIMDGGTIFIPISLAYFAMTLIGDHREKKKFFLANFFVGIIFFALLLFTDLFFQGLGEFVESMGYYVFNYGWAYYPFLLWFFVFSFWSFYRLFSKARDKRLDQLKRQQFNFVSWGLLFVFILGSINFLLDYITIPFYYNLLVPFYLVFIGLAIVKNKLFDVKVIATELLVAFMGFILLVLPFLMPSYKLVIAASAVLIIYCFIGFLLIKTTMEEVNAKESLEQKVQERTKELETSKKVAEDRAAELEKWYNLTIGRELRMAELKEKIKEMEEKK